MMQLCALATGLGTNADIHKDSGFQNLGRYNIYKDTLDDYIKTLLLYLPWKILSRYIILVILLVHDKKNKLKVWH